MLAITLQPVEYNVLQGLAHWAIVFGLVLLVSLFVSLVASLATNGLRGPARVVRHLGQAANDFISLSPRRIYAVSWLTFLEAIRRKALLVFVVFAVLFMFGSWFLSGGSDRPELDVEVYVGFVFTAITWLVLPVAILLSCWGLPEDIRLRSLHTVVTKPVRRNEIVLGRIFGFGAVNTLIMGVMGIVGLIWIYRQAEGIDLVCRVPIYGTLSFVDRTGVVSDKGVNVGDIVEKRSFLEGGSKAAAYWSFPMPSSQTELMQFESRFEGFRTYKGEMERQLRVRFTLINEDKQLAIPLPDFSISDFGKVEIPVQRSLTFTDPKAVATGGAAKPVTYDLFKDLAPNGTLLVKVQCLDRGQYLGVSRGDFFIRTLPDRPFYVGYWKALCGVWLMVILLVMIGVTASCFVKGPVASFLCFFVLILGQPAEYFHQFVDKVVAQKPEVGGGAVESVYRIVMQMNQTVALDAGPFKTCVQAIDAVPRGGLWLAMHLIPDLGSFWTVGWIGKGLDVPWSGALLPSIAITLGYMLPCVLLGYFSLTLRELEAK